MKTVLIHINARKVCLPGQPPLGASPRPSAKEFPREWWEDVIAALPEHRFVQIGVQGDDVLNGVPPQFDLSEAELVALARRCDHVVCVDSFLPHLLHAHACPPGGLKCIVLFSKSDPLIFGYPENINLLKDRKHLRPDQFATWDLCPYDLEAFIEPGELVRLLK